MNAKVVSIINYKGGVGKSTVTLNLGAELANKGYKVLLVDFDGQGNLTRFTGIEQRYDCSINLITALKHVMNHEEVTENPIYKKRDNLYIVPCDISKEGWMNSALSVLARETILKRYLDTLRSSFEYILIDNAPSINLDLQNSLVASDYYLLVTEAESASTEGANVIKRIISEITSVFKLELKSAGVVVNKVEERANLHKGILGMIEGHWNENIYVIPKSIVVGESQLLQKTISEHEPKSKMAKAYLKFANDFEEVTNQDVLQEEKSWQ